MENASSTSTPPPHVFAARPVVAPTALSIGVFSACHGARAASLNLRHLFNVSMTDRGAELFCTLAGEWGAGGHLLVLPRQRYSRRSIRKLSVQKHPKGGTDLDLAFQFVGQITWISQFLVLVYVWSPKVQADYLSPIFVKRFKRGPKREKREH